MSERVGFIKIPGRDPGTYAIAALFRDGTVVVAIHVDDLAEGPVLKCQGLPKGRAREFGAFITAGVDALPPPARDDRGWIDWLEGAAREAFAE